jgi:putative Holliday junction resolvase
MSTDTRKVGLDIGEKRIGVAVSDALGLTAQPLDVVVRRSQTADVEAIMRLLEQYRVGEFVAGLPLNMDGSEGAQADAVRHFCSRLEALTSIPVRFQDERLTTVESERLMIDSGMRRAKRRTKVDKTAAALILQSHLDSHAGEQT